MSHLKHPGSSALPRTFVGRWLRASMLDQREERDRLVHTLNGGSATGWNDDEPAVVEAALELVLQYFNDDQVGIGELAGLVSAALAADHRQDDGPKAAALINAALGADASGADQVARMDRFRLNMLAATAASAKLQLEEAGVDAVLREAERLAFERGWHPPLVPRIR